MMPLKTFLSKRRKSCSEWMAENELTTSELALAFCEREGLELRQEDIEKITFLLEPPVVATEPQEVTVEPVLAATEMPVSDDETEIVMEPTKTRKQRKETPST